MSDESPYGVVYREIDGRLKGQHVFLEADFPAESKISAQETTDAVNAIARAVIGEGGKLLCSWHPTISPMLLHIANELRALFVIDIFRTCWSKDNIDTQTLDLFQKNVGWIHWTPPTDSEEVTRSVLYDRLFDHTKPAAAVFVGGNANMENVWLKLGDAHPEIPQFPLVMPGGQASNLYSQASDQYAGSLAQLLTSRSYPMVAGMLMRYITPTATSNAVQSHS